MEESLFECENSYANYATNGDIKSQPLASRMRPRNLDEFVGQTHLLAPGKLLRRAIDADMFSSIILSGPPGVGKTSLAELIAKLTDSDFIRLSGVTSNVADIRDAIKRATSLKRATNRRTILFIDEIHRFNKAQQDSLLPDVENGNIRLIGATTHNVQFYIVGALLSRSLVFTLKSLTEGDIIKLIRLCLNDERSFGERQVILSDEAITFLAKRCEGDARKALNALELAVLTTIPDGNECRINLATIEESIQQKFINYDADTHYDSASAFIKSMRGSDADAAIYYLAKMLAGGEDIRFIARRIVIFASEDIGNADPRALQLATSAMQAIEMIGMPEARIILAQAVTYCATAPKSNASYLAIGQALDDVENDRILPIPIHLKDKNSNGTLADKHQQDYKYPHDTGGFVVQDYLSVEKRYYEPKPIGYELKIKERVDYWNSLRTFEKDDKTRN